MKKKNLLASFLGALMLVTVLSIAFPANALIDSNKSTSPKCETCNSGCDMELVEIIPYYYGSHGYDFLYFSCKVKNVGYETCSPYGFEASAYRIKDNKRVGDITTSTVGELEPGEEGTYSGRNGLVFNDFYFPPTYFRLNFTTRPNDPNKENNYLEEIYLLWGGFPNNVKYKKITGTNPFSMPGTVNNFFIERLLYISR